MVTFRQLSFAGGELAPALHARVDLVKYQTGVRTLRNGMVLRHGGMTARPGTEFVCPLRNEGAVPRLWPFVFSTVDTYLLVFEPTILRIVRRVGGKSGLVTFSPVTITGITQGNPATVTAPDHGFANGDEVWITGVEGMSQVNNRSYLVADATANTFTLKDTTTGLYVSSASWDAYAAGGTAAKVFVLPTPYLAADLPSLRFVQSGDVLTITHPNYAPRNLTRSGHTSWTLDAIKFEPAIPRPTNGQATAGGSGTKKFHYRVTAVDSRTREESLPCLSAQSWSITGATQAKPVVLTIGSHTLEIGDEVYITGVVGMVELNDKAFTVGAISGTTISLYDDLGQPIDGTTFGAYVSGGLVRQTFIRLTSAAEPTPSAPHQIVVNAVPQAQEYNVYKEENGAYGFLGVAKALSPANPVYKDIGATPDTLQTHPQFRNPFDRSDRWPRSSTYYGSRQAFGGSKSEPETIRLSRVGQYANFSIRSPIQDDDSITFTPDGRQVNEVLHMLDLGVLAIFTRGAEIVAQGDQSGVITPSRINAKIHSYYGCADLQPLLVGRRALFVQARQSIVLDWGYDFEADGYRAVDLTAFAGHLVDGFTLRDWAYQQTPHSIIWVARNDGVLLGLTYIREHSLLAWHRHDTDGAFEALATVPEGEEEGLYFAVRRQVSGVPRRYLERLVLPKVTPQAEYVGLDAAVTYRGTNVNSALTLTISGGTNWTPDEVLTVTASASLFTSRDVGKTLRITGPDGSTVRLAVETYVSATQVSGRPNKTIPAALRNAATSSWGLMVRMVEGLLHLEGKEVAALGDGHVAASPKNPSFTSPVVVGQGKATFTEPYEILHVGLPYLVDIETLDIDLPQGESLSGRAKAIGQVHVFVEKTQGLWAGPKAPADGAPATDGLEEYPPRSTETYDLPPQLLSGVITIPLRGEWNSHGRVFLRRIDPVPFSILAVSPEGLVPLRG